MKRPSAYLNYVFFTKFLHLVACNYYDILSDPHAFSDYLYNIKK